MNKAVIDTHSYIKRLQETGFSEEQAEAISMAYSYADNELVTKKDIEDIAAKQDIDQLQKDMGHLEDRINARIQQVGSDLYVHLLLSMVIICGALMAFIEWRVVD